MGQRCVLGHRPSMMTKKRRRPFERVSVLVLVAQVWLLQLQAPCNGVRLPPAAPVATPFVPRGGKQHDHSVDDTVEENDDSSTTDQDQPVSSFWSPTSLFRLGNNVKVDASLTAATAPNGRGGAMVKAKPTSRLRQWLPLDMASVGPLWSRLFENDSAGEEAPARSVLLKQSSNVTTTTTSETVDNEAPMSSELVVAEETKTETRSRAEIALDELDEDDEEEDELDMGEEHDISQQVIVSEIDVVSQVTSRADARLMEQETLDLDEGERRYQQHDMLALPPPLQPEGTTTSEDESVYISSGYWSPIDSIISLGLANLYPELRVSRRLRPVRKLAARVTGLHGVLSGKVTEPATEAEEMNARIGAVRRRLAAIARARENVERIEAVEASKSGVRRGLFGRLRQPANEEEYGFVLKKSTEEILRERRRKQRVKEIDRLIAESQKRLLELACEKDVLQRRPNPLWNYTITDEEGRQTEHDKRPEDHSLHHLVSATRDFNFPPKDLVDEYMEMLLSSGRLLRLNHTDLWKKNPSMEDDDDDDELSGPRDNDLANLKKRNGSNGSGNWLLRQGLGEKLGESIETSAYKAVCAAIMSVLARSLSSLHGVNVMTYADIRLFMEQTPDLPPLAAGIIPASGKSTDYAQGAIEHAMRRSVKKRKKKRHQDQHFPYRQSVTDDFIQRDAVVETLLSHCQISAPLLKLFPIAWQRAMLGNIITLITAIISDFFEGLELNILGHRLTFSFTPISEADMLRSLGSVGEGFNRHRARPEYFEAAVSRTAAGLAKELKFLDRWHERVLGSDMLRSQIANLIARLVLTLVDDILTGARMDLWAAHAGGPRLVAGLEYRTTPNYVGGATAESSI